MLENVFFIVGHSSFALSLVVEGTFISRKGELICVIIVFQPCFLYADDMTFHDSVIIDYINEVFFQGPAVKLDDLSNCLIFYIPIRRSPVQRNIMKSGEFCKCQWTWVNFGSVKFIEDV